MTGFKKHNRSVTLLQFEKFENLYLKNTQHTIFPQAFVSSRKTNYSIQYPKPCIHVTVIRRRWVYFNTEYYYEVLF